MQNRVLLLFTLNLAVAFEVSAQTGVLGLAAGNGASLYSGDNVPATQTAVGLPYQVAFDNSGNLYIADTANSLIRKVDSASGIITTVAGGGQGGDGSLAVNAALNSPCGVRVDAANNIYISESCLVATSGSGGGTATVNRIRRVDAVSGIITTIAGNGTGGYSGDGGPATSASLYVPSGMAIDSAGNLFIADSQNHRVRKVSAATQVITTVAGNGVGGFAGDGGLATQASLNVPTAVALDGAGNLYISDALNFRIRKVNAATGIISTVAGNGASGYNGDGLPATAASLYFPLDIAVDSAGNFYIADGSNQRIRAVNAATGSISTLVGGGSAAPADGAQASAVALNQPAGLALGPDGKLYFSNRQSNQVFRIALPVNAAPTTTSLTASPNPATTQQSITFTATVSPATATGSVTFLNAGNAFATVTLSNGVASVTVSAPAAGTYSLTAQYTGAAGFASSASTVVTLSVKNATTLTLSSSANPSQTGQPVTLTATVTPTSASGTIQFFDGATSIGTATLASGVATFSTSQLSAGNHAVSATYSGDTLNASATSSVLTQTVNAPALACRVVYTVTTQWNVGFGGAVKIINTGSTVIRPWSLTWTWPSTQRITQSWNSNYSQNGAAVKLDAASWNTTINPGATIDGVGFNATYSGSNPTPTAFFVNGVRCQ